MKDCTTMIGERLCYHDGPPCSCREPLICQDISGVDWLVGKLSTATIEGVSCACTRTRGATNVLVCMFVLSMCAQTQCVVT